MGNMGEIQINTDLVESSALTVHKAADELNGGVLSPRDDESTITANGKGKLAFDQSQNFLSELQSTLQQEADNIKDLGVKFEGFDKQAAIENSK